MEWNKLSDAEKQPYKDLAAKNKAAAPPKEKKDKAPAKAAAAPKGAKKEKAEKEEGPKKPVSAYMYFSNAKRAEIKEANPGIAVTEIAKLLGEQWRNADDAAKAPFVAMANKDKTRYANEKKA